jgi:hypothetical protein|tara:strand:- start:232 stop:450 length:219 start_codon:yes stop_codon:yes gene_type:complete
MGFTDLPAKYYEKEGFFSLMGIGYTASLVVLTLGAAQMFKGSGANHARNTLPIIGGGALATWGYLKSSGVLY